MNQHFYLSQDNNLVRKSLFIKAQCNYVLWPIKKEEVRGHDSSSEFSNRSTKLTSMECPQLLPYQFNNTGLQSIRFILTSFQVAKLAANERSHFVEKKHVHDYTPHGTHFQIRAERLLSQKMLKGLTINLLSTYTKRINTTFTEYTYMYMSIHHLRTNIYCYNLTANNTGNIMMQPLLVSPRLFSYSNRTRTHKHIPQHSVYITDNATLLSSSKLSNICQNILRFRFC